MKLWAKIYRLRAMILTLLYHRSIIEELSDKVKWTEDNAFKIINLMTRRNVGIRISEQKKSFGYTVMLSRGSTNAYLKSERRIPPIQGVEHSIFLMDEYDKEKAGKKNTNEKI